MPPWDPARIRAELDDAGVAVRDVERVLLTHYDLDHVGMLASLAPELDATVYGGRFDLELLAGWRTPTLAQSQGRVAARRRSDARLAVTRVQGVSGRGDDRHVHRVHTPGYMSGHIAYVSEVLDVALLGDLVRASNGTLEPSGWAISYDTAQVRESIARLAAESPSFEIACPVTAIRSPPTVTVRSRR